MASHLDSYKFGGRPQTSINLLLLISEMEGTYQHLKYMGFEEDMNTIDNMKKKYYSLYFKTAKAEKANNPLWLSGRARRLLIVWSQVRILPGSKELETFQPRCQIYRNPGINPLGIFTTEIVSYSITNCQYVGFKCPIASIRISVMYAS